MNTAICDLEKIQFKNKNLVGGKNASLGEMLLYLKNKNILIPEGFILNNDAFKQFIAENTLNKDIYSLFFQCQNDSIEVLSLKSALIEKKILDAIFPENLITLINEKYNNLINQNLSESISFAIRSSSNDEDGENNSFAGQQNSYLNIIGIENIVNTIKLVYASLYSVQSLSYRIKNNCSIIEASMSICIQKMIRSDIGCSGVIFTAEPESGNQNIISISSNYGLGESIVQGISNPDEFLIHKTTQSIIQKNLGCKKTKVIFNNINTKVVETTLSEQRSFSISEDDIHQLAHYALIIENHFSQPMDIEWAKDGLNNKLYILQARPITTLNKSRAITEYKIKEKGNIITFGKAIGKKAIHGKVCIINSLNEMHLISKGDILVTNMTDPRWEPIMKIASGIVTNLGGRTCHAAIIARELGVPAIVGCTDATQKLIQNQKITVSCCQGDIGFIYDNWLEIEKNQIKIQEQNNTKKNIKIMLNISNPSLAFDFAQLPNDGVGLTRIEFIINNHIGIHPMAIIQLEKLDKTQQEIIFEKTVGYNTPYDFFVSKLAEGIATIAAAFYPKKVIIRLSDFKTNEYRNLFGGNNFEIVEENPMIGFRGAMRYLSEDFFPAFKMEIEALKKVIFNMKLTNIALLVPFVRTLSEAREVISLLAKNGLERSEKLPIYMMCEIPSNALLAEQFLEYFDGFSIGSNDMTQLVLGIDRDGGKLVTNNFDERNDAVKAILKLAINACKKNNKYIGICGQGPSDHIDFAQWLIDEGIESISLLPDTIIPFQNYLNTK
jgi:pyruvate,water dikinase